MNPIPPAPTPAPKRITEDSQPVFPCWLWAPSTTGYAGSEIKALWYKMNDAEQFRYDRERVPTPTHWLPDQPTAPTCVPTEGENLGDILEEAQNPTHSAQEAAEEAAEEIDKTVRQFTGHTGTLPDFTPLLQKHFQAVPAQQTTTAELTPYKQAILMLAHFDLQYHRLMMAARSVIQSQRPQSDAQVCVLKSELDALDLIANEKKPDWSKIDPEAVQSPGSGEAMRAVVEKVASGSQLRMDFPRYRLPESLCDEIRDALAQPATPPTAEELAKRERIKARGIKHEMFLTETLAKLEAAREEIAQLKAATHSLPRDEPELLKARQEKNKWKRAAHENALEHLRETEALHAQIAQPAQPPTPPLPSGEGLKKRIDRCSAILGTLRTETRPVSGHQDPGALEDCWREAFDELVQMEELLAQPPNVKIRDGKDGERLSLLEDLGTQGLGPDWDDNGFWFTRIKGQYISGTTLRHCLDAVLEARTQADAGRDTQ